VFFLPHPVDKLCRRSLTERGLGIETRLEPRQTKRHDGIAMALSSSDEGGFISIFLCYQYVVISGFQIQGAKPSGSL